MVDGILAEHFAPQALEAGLDAQLHGRQGAVLGQVRPGDELIARADVEDETRDVVERFGRLAQAEADGLAGKQQLGAMEQPPLLR